MECNLKNRFPIFFLSTILLVLAQPVKAFRQVLGIDTDLVIPDKRLSVYEGAVAPWKGEKLGWWKEQFIKGAKKFNFPVHKPIVDLTEKQYKILWEGNEYAMALMIFLKKLNKIYIKFNTGFC